MASLPINTTQKPIKLNTTFTFTLPLLSVTFRSQPTKAVEIDDAPVNTSLDFYEDSLGIGAQTMCIQAYYISAPLLYIVGVLGTVVSSLGILFNVINLAVLLNKKSSKAAVTPSLFVLLSFSDLLYLVTFFVFGSCQTLLHYYHPEQPILAGEKFKYYVDVIGTTAVSASIFTTVALTADRCVAVARPFKWSTRRNNACYYVIVVCIVLSSVILSLPMLVDRAIHSDDFESRNCSSMLSAEQIHNSANLSALEESEAFNLSDIAKKFQKVLILKPDEAEEEQEILETEFRDEKTNFASSVFQSDVYLKAILPFCQLLLPATAMVCFTIYTLYALRHNKVGVRPNPTSTVEKTSKIAKASNRITAQIISMATVTLVANAMHAGTFVVMSINDTIYINDCSEFCEIYVSLSHLMLALNSSINLILFCVFNKAFRNSVLRIILPSKLCGKTFDVTSAVFTSSQSHQHSKKTVISSFGKKK